jgi:hypothetical protein
MKKSAMKPASAIPASTDPKVDSTPHAPDASSARLRLTQAWPSVRRLSICSPVMPSGPEVSQFRSCV